jgi:hypothetical protein
MRPVLPLNEHAALEVIPQAMKIRVNTPGPDLLHVAIV